MIERELDCVNLDDAFFDVQLRPIYFDKVVTNESELNPNNRSGAHVVKNGIKMQAWTVQIPRYYVVVDCQRENPIVPVTSDYVLITNREAYEQARNFVSRVFSAIKIEDMVCWNVRLSKNRGVCYIDLLAASRAEIKAGFSDREFIPFVRIVNSYNKTLCLSYEIGFCRWICKNGLIFGKMSVKFKTNHSIGAREIYDEMEGKIADVKEMERMLVASTVALKKFRFANSDVLPMFCRVFGIKKSNANSKPVVDRYVRMRRCVETLWQEYSDQYGEYGYAVFNVLTDFATYPEGVISTFSERRRLQGIAGEWIQDFSREINRPDFSISTYIGERAYATAHWLRSLVA